MKSVPPEKRETEVHGGDVETSMELGAGALVLACLMRWLLM